MKKFRFKLETVLKLREFHEKEAKQALARAMGDLATIENDIRRIADEYSRAAASRFLSANTILDIKNYEAYLFRLEKTKEVLLEKAAKAELVVEAARAVFVEASRDRKVIEKLKEKKISIHRREAMQEEMMLVDEISGAKTARLLLHADQGDSGYAESNTQPAGE